MRPTTLRNLALILLVSIYGNSFYSQTADLPQLLPNADELSGYFRTVEDIETGNVIPMKVVSIETLSSKFEIEGSGGKREKVNINKLEQSYWGFTTWGTYYRFVAQFPGNGSAWTKDQTDKKKVYMPICKVGAICLYGPITIGSTKTNEDGDIIPMYKYETFIPTIYLSKGLTGNVCFGDFNRLRELVSDEPDLVKIIDDLHLSESVMNWFPGNDKNFGVFMGVIDEYNRIKAEIAENN